MTQRLVGSFPRRTSRIREKIDFLLTRAPSVYLSIEQRRKWINWDKRVYLAFVRPGDVVFDIGANVGVHAAFLSHLVGPAGRVIAYEPVPATFQELNQTLLERCRYPNVTPLQFALGSGATGRRVVTMHVPDADFTQAALTPHSANSWSGAKEIEKFDVPFSTLDEQVRRIQAPRVDFVKIDVEGGELAVLSGGQATLSKFLPYVYCEVYESWARTFDYEPLELFSRLYSLGYIGARVFHRDTVDAVDPDTPPSAEWFAESTDVLFFSDAHRDAVARLDRRFGVSRYRGKHG